MDGCVSTILAGIPEGPRQRLLAVRALVFLVAEDLGKEVVESLKWGQPSYAVPGGTPLRVNWASTAPDIVSMYFHCQTKMVKTLRQTMPDAFEYIGNRELQLSVEAPIPLRELRVAIEAAFTYRAWSRGGAFSGGDSHG